MHHLSPVFRRKILSLGRSLGCQDLVRFFALLRIKPHAPPLVRAPVNAFEFQPCGRTPGGVLNALAAALSPGKDPTPSTHRLRRGLPGYLILFAPHAFEPQRQLQTREPLSPPVFLHISTHFTATHGIPLSPSALKFDSFQSILWLSHSLLLQTYQTACARFTPNKSGQRSGPTYYRGCWHVVSRPFLVRYRHLINFPL